MVAQRQTQAFYQYRPVLTLSFSIYPIAYSQASIAKHHIRLLDSLWHPRYPRSFVITETPTQSTNRAVRDKNALRYHRPLRRNPDRFRSV